MHWRETVHENCRVIILFSNEDVVGECSGAWRALGQTRLRNGIPWPVLQKAWQDKVIKQQTSALFDKQRTRKWFGMVGRLFSQSVYCLFDT